MSDPNNGPMCPLGKPPCVDETARQELLYRREAHRLRRYLWRFELRHREERLAALILEMSYGNGRQWVAIPALDVLVKLTGITKGNVSTTLKSLHDMRIILVRAAGRTVLYEINPHPEEWRCRVLSSVEQSQRAAEMIRAFNATPIDQAIPIMPQQQQEGAANFKSPHPASILPPAVPEETEPLGRPGDFPELD